jgi:hypothetical protein
MNELLASVFSGLIIDENDTHYFVQKNGLTFKLAKSEGESKTRIMFYNGNSKKS